MILTGFASLILMYSDTVSWPLDSSGVGTHVHFLEIPLQTFTADDCMRRPESDDENHAVNVKVTPIAVDLF